MESNSSSQDRSDPSQSDGQQRMSNDATAEKTHQADHPSDEDKSDPLPTKSSILERVKAIWAKTGIDSRMYRNMFKGALAPTIAVAAFQGTAYAHTFSTIGYLVGIMAVLSIVIAPRTKFLQTMLINIVVVGIACCLALLAMYCSIRARTDTVGYQGPGHGGPGTSGLAATGAQTSEYNSSASAVAGVWLFVQIYGISAVRAKNAQYTVPGIMFAIFANVSMVYAPQFSSMKQASTFAYRLLSAFYTGFAIAIGVSLLVFPMTSRQVVFKTMTAYIKTLQKAVSANIDYMHSLEDGDMFAAQRTNTQGEKPPRSPEAEAFKARMRELAGLLAKLHGDLPFAKREIALGKLGPDDIQEIFRQLRSIMIPIVGLSCMSDIFELVAERTGWDRSCSVVGLTADAAIDDAQKMRIETVNEWHELMKMLKRPFALMSSTINDGLDHILITLQFQAAPKQANDNVEADGDVPQPGDKDYAQYFEGQANAFLKTKETMLRGWCQLHDIELPEDFFSNPDQEDFHGPDWMHEGYLSATHQYLRRQLFLCLYMEFLLFNIARRTHKLITVADHLRDSGKLRRNRLVVPGWKRIRKWFTSFFDAQQDTDGDDERVTDGRTIQVYLGDAYNLKKDPEHLPPANSWERFGNQFRKVSHFFSSSASAFGFRCACATISIAVVSFLRPTQVFFTRERLFWAQIMVSISMSPSAGQSLRNFILRIVGTIVALLASWIAWYIVDGHTAGILVFLFIFLHAGPYVLIKYPQYTPVGMIGQITMILIIGYELQVRKLGIAEAESNGQAYYSIYELGPFRLATVCGGLLVAWIWTIFPYPISEHNQMRHSLGKALYLLANYYSVMHETVRARLSESHGDINMKDSPAYKLEKARLKIYSKANLTIQGMRTQAAFLKFDIPIGGKFPQAQYQKLVEHVQGMLNFISLVSVASSTFSDMQEFANIDHGRQWLRNFRKLVGEANITSQQITTLLSLLSASVEAGNPLPPYLRVPEAYLLEQRLDELDKDLLSVRHIAEPGYSSFAVMQVGTKCIIDELKRMMLGIKELVGELDFSYHIVNTSRPGKDESAETLVYAGAQDKRSKSD